MAKSIRDSNKSKPKIGRPKTTGSGEAQIVRMHRPQIAAIDTWIKAQSIDISRPEAIRRLVELGLTVKLKGPQRGERQRRRAREIAGEVIDQISDSAAPGDEQAGRKRRLLKGPEEFRETRVDRPKAKK